VLALLAQRQRALERTRLDPQQLEVVVEPGGGLVAGVQACVAGDLAAIVADHDLACADRRLHAQPDERDRYRVAVLPDRDQRLRIDARRRMLARVEVDDRLLPQRPRLDCERLADRLGAAADPAAEVGEAAVLEQVVELLQGRYLRHRHQVRPPVAADLAFDAALLVRPYAAGAGEGRLVQVVGAQRNEAVLLDAPAAAQHLLDRRAQIVVADRLEDAAEEVNACTCASRNACCVCRSNAITNVAPE